MKGDLKKESSGFSSLRGVEKFRRAVNLVRGDNNISLLSVDDREEDLLLEDSLSNDIIGCLFEDVSFFSGGEYAFDILDDRLPDKRYV